jgi:hypothetical protein
MTTYISKYSYWILPLLCLSLVLLSNMELSAQATLPLSRTTWTAGPPQGWTDFGTGSYATSFACSGNNMGQLNSTGDYYRVQFTCSPDQLVFKLKSASMSGESYLEVEESEDGTNWNPLGTYGTCGGCTTIDDCDDITHALDPATRFVRWKYTKAIGNCGLDDVSIGALGSCFPIVGFDLAASSLDEGDAGNTNHTVSVTMESVPANNVTVDITDTGNGTADPNTDYTFTTTSLTFTTVESYPATKSVNVTVHGDFDVESDETVILEASIVAGDATLGQDEHTITIVNDDQASTWYRTSGDGNWTSPSIWEISNNAGSSWSAASTYPTPSNSDQVSVQHQVTINADVSIDDVTIESGATVTIPSTSEWLLSNQGADPQLVINGTLIDGGSTSNGLAFESGTRWLMGDNGTVIKTNNNGASNYRDNYFNNPSAPDLPSGSTFIYRYTGSPMSVSSSGWSYGHLTFESNAGYFAFNQGNTRINEFGDFTIKGTLDIGGNGTGTVLVLNQKAVTQLEGDLVIRSGSELSNNSYNGSTPVGERIDFSGSNITVDGILRHTFGEGEFRFLSDAGISGTNDHFKTYQLTANAEPTFNAHAIVTNNILFGGNYHIITTGTAEIKLETTVPASIIGYNEFAYIEGRLRRDVFPVSGYHFPVGDALTYGLFTLDFNTTDADNVLGYFNPVGSPIGNQDCLNPNLTYNYEKYCGGWSVTPNTGNNHNYTITLSAALDNATHYTIVKDDVIDPCPTGLSESYTDFSQFDLQGADQALPVEWASFEAFPFQDWVRLSWETYSEINNAFYAIEHSPDGHTFREIGRSYSAGTSAARSLYFIDHFTPIYGLNYYRLTQEDYDGTRTSSIIRVVDFRRATTEPWVIMNDGSGNQFRLVSNALTKGQTQLRIYALDGRLLKELNLPKNQRHFDVAMHEYISGTYLFQIQEERGYFPLKVTKW